MIHVLGPTRIVWSIGLLAVALVSVSLWSGMATTASEVWKQRALILFAINIFVLLLTVRPILRCVHWVSLAKFWWFPWLDGNWDAEISSNWPTVERLKDAAAGTVEQLDIMSDKGAAPPLVVSAVATIKMGLFDIQITLRPNDTDRVSRTLFVRPSWCKPSLPMLHYVYEQTDARAVARTDQRSHLGAAYLVFDPEKGTLDGEYWTQRQATIGLNTAGLIRLRRSLANGK